MILLIKLFCKYLTCDVNFGSIFDNPLVLDFGGCPEEGFPIGDNGAEMSAVDIRVPDGLAGLEQNQIMKLNNN